MDTFYFTVGEFCAQGMGSNYNGYGCKFISVDANTYIDALAMAYEYGEAVYGQREYKDLWYGEYAWTWKIEPHTEKSWKIEYQKMFDTLKYHTERAAKLFGNEPDYNNLHKIFAADYPVLHINNDKNITASSIEFEIERNTTRKEIPKPENVKTIIKPKETNSEREFFN